MSDKVEPALTPEPPVHVGLSYLVDEWREPTEEERARGVLRVITKATLTGASFVSPPETK